MIYNNIFVFRKPILYSFCLAFLFFLPLNVLFAATDAENTSNSTTTTVTPQVVQNPTIEVLATPSELSLSLEKKFDLPFIDNTIDLENDNSLVNMKNFADVFASTSSVVVSGSPRRTGQNLSIRGFDENSIVILVDEVPRYLYGQHESSVYLDPNIVKSVEILKGPFTSIYGGNAVGGLINFKTYDATDLLDKGKTYGGMISLGASTIDNSYNYSVSTYAAKDNMDFLAEVSGGHSNDITSGTPSKDINGGDPVKILQDDEMTTGLLKFGYYFNENSYVKVSENYYNSNSLVPSNSEVYNKLDHNLIVNDSLTSVDSYIYTDNPLTPNFKTVVYYDYTQQDEIALEDSSVGYNKGDTLGRNINTFGIRHIEDISSKVMKNISNTVYYGLDLQTQNQDKNSEDVRGVYANASENKFGFLLQDETFFWDKVILTEAVRYDSINVSQHNTSSEDDYSKASPKVSLEYSPWKFLMTYISYGRAFTAPNLNQIYAAGVHFPGYCVGPFCIPDNYLIPNPDLKPATSDTLEAGYGFNFDNIDKIGGSFNFKNSFYAVRTKDFIGLDISIMDGTAQYVNIDNTQMSGIDLESSYKNDYVTLTLSYSYLDAINTDTGNRLDNISNNYGAIVIEYNIIRNLFGQNVSIGYRGRGQSDYNLNEAVVNAGFFLNDIFLTIKDNKHYRFSFAVDNLGDKYYYSTYSAIPGSGRSYRFEVTYKI